MLLIHRNHIKKQQNVVKNGKTLKTYFIIDFFNITKKKEQKLKTNVFSLNKIIG